jgi:FkbM family methyltransferase
VNFVNRLINLGRVFSSHPLTRDAPVKAWVRLGVFQLKARLEEEVIVPWMSGQRLVVRLHMTGATESVYVGLHEFADMLFVAHFLREDDLFMDIGANVGVFTVIASGVCRARTWAFEPDPDTVSKFKRNVEINNLQNFVTLYQLALGASTEDVFFTIGRDQTNKVASDSDKNKRLVCQEKLDTLVRDSKPILLKIDVERYEEEVLLGAQSLLSNDSLKAIEIETVTTRSKDLLIENGFLRAYYYPHSRALTRQPNGLASANALFVRDFDFVANRLASAKTVTVLGQEI